MATPEISIRRCNQADVTAVLRIWHEERSAHASVLDRREDIERLLSDSPAALFVAESGGAIVGAVIAGWDGWRGNIYRLAVRERDRRRGVGLALVRASEDYLRQRGVGRATALVAFDDEAAGRFWDSAGYPTDEEIGRRVRNIRPGVT